mmetsp:Transcript_41361/g.95541  ORF Transcript_41361/g.95541 Transcript_41361/m.95541 type:complete len:957 (+) Transcript_41361:51-2921(+)
MMKSSALLTLSVALLPAVNADVYMHNPRGSNDRNCERNVNRNNGNRLFDSQNNAKGGYACPRAVGDANIQAEDGTGTIGGETQDKTLYYYEGSVLPVEWTNQHGCGANSKVNCEIVIQYACEDTLDPQVDNFWPFTDTKNNDANVGDQAFRSGANLAAPRDGIPTDANDAATDTIPDTEDAAIPDTNADQRYGMHESYDFYQLCQHTARNEGLYTADQRVRRNDQRGTRQNPNGNRRGLECPEERDYYPWWQPSPWVDAAILTNDAGATACTDPAECETARCKYYLEESFNKKEKGYCDVNHNNGDVEDKTTSQAWNNREWYNNKEDCEGADGNFKWYAVKLSDVLDVGYPVCMKTGFSRVNQLGNSFDATVNGTDDAPFGVNANRFLWTIPDIPSVVTGAADETNAGFEIAADDDYFTGNADGAMEDAYQSCTLRVRYNLSTSDFPAWPAEAMEDAHPWKGLMVTAENNTQNNGDGDATPLQQDPYIYVGAGDDNSVGSQFVSLAANTNQYARTFQDRSYRFAIKKKPTADAAADNSADTPKVNDMTGKTGKIYNVNVRGKRGNIVQTYPAVEYDFVPNSLALDEGDMIHFQWQGSDYNPRRGCNDAEGGPPDPNDGTSTDAQNSRADRSNIVFMDFTAANIPMDYLGYKAATAEDDDDNPSGLNYNAKVAMMKETMVNNTPCGGDADCFDSIIRLSYLNQQSDGGSLGFRDENDCLTEAQLDNINNQQERENHPLNCAKLNAKPYPYFDGGIMNARKAGQFAYFSSRNNNFSNRDQTGNICVRGIKSDGTEEKCEVDTSTFTLQGANPAISTASMRISSGTAAPAKCTDSANGEGSGAANDQGASSCLTDDSGTDDDMLSGSTFTVEQAANDAMGDGDERSCEEITFFYSLPDAAKKAILAVVLLSVGCASGYAAWFVYNRVQAQRKKDAAENLDKGLGKGWDKDKEKTDNQMI